MTEHEVMTRFDILKRWSTNPVFRLFGGLFCVFCVSNLLLAIRADNLHNPSGLELLFMGFAVGAIGAQAELHAIWTVFSTWSRTHRFAISVLTALALYLTFIGIYWLGPDRYTTIVAVQALLCLPLSLLAIQLPLWCLKAGWRWCVFRADAGADYAEASALRIQDLLFATTAIAVAIALARYAMTLNGEAIDSDGPIVMFAVPLIAAVVSLLTTAPTLLATLRFENMAFGVWAVLTFEAAIYFGWFAVMCVIAGAPPPESVALFVGVFTGFTVSLHAPLCYLRCCGYRLGRPDLAPTNKEN